MNPCDMDALEKMYLQYAPRLMRIAYGILRNQQDAEDALHTAFVALTAHADRLADPDSSETKAYLSRTVKNCALNLQAKRQRVLRFEESYPDYEIGEVTDEMLEKLCSQATMETILSAVANLPDSYRDVVYLFYVEEKKTEEIAKILNLKGAAVRQRLVRGRKQLADALRKEMARE